MGDMAAAGSVASLRLGLMPLHALLPFRPTKTLGLRTLN